jgi:hypothetical protein
MTRAYNTATTQQNSGGATPAFLAGKNKIINGDFGIWQRGTSLSVTTNAGAFLADRFLLNFAGTFTGTLSQQTFVFHPKTFFTKNQNIIFFLPNSQM